MIHSVGFIERDFVYDQILNYYRAGHKITYDSILCGDNNDLLEDCMRSTNNAIDIANGNHPENKLKLLKVPTVQMVVLILTECDDIALVRFNESAEPNLAFRIRDIYSEYDGVWCLVETSKFCNEFDKLIIALNPAADEKFRKEVRRRLKIELSNGSKIKTALVDGVNIPCRNGVFNRKTKTFLSWDDYSFDAEYGNYAFIFKLKVNYNPYAKNVIITSEEDGTPHSPWDFETHLTTLFDDNTPEKCELYKKAFWEVASHVISGYSQGYGFFWCNSSGLSKGASGKSTLLAALKAIIGETDVCSNSINSLCEDAYAFPQIIGKVAILSDEMDESVSVISGYDNIKMLFTNEIIPMREIYKEPIFFRPKLTFVQCCNQMPRFKNPSESFFRRLRVIPFEKTFATDGYERQYIKNDYMKRNEVLEYIVRKCLEEVEIKYSADVLEATSAKKSIMEYSFTVVQFMNELTAVYPIIADFDIIPAPLLYDMFSNWYEVTNHTKTNLSAYNFWKQLVSWVDNNTDWECVNGVHKIPKPTGYDYVYESVFSDYPANVQNRTWTTVTMRGDTVYTPNRQTFRNGIRFIGIPPRGTVKFLRNVVLKDETGEWHKEYEAYKQLYVDNNIRMTPLDFEDWVERGCLNYYNKKERKIDRKEQSGDTPLCHRPIYIRV